MHTCNALDEDPGLGVANPRDVRLAASDAWLADMLPALLVNDIFPLMPLTFMLPAFVVIVRLVVGGAVMVKSTPVELKKLNVPDLLTVTFTVLPLLL